MARSAQPADTESVQILWFTPIPPISGYVAACAGPVEVVDCRRGDRVLPDRQRILRVRSLGTGNECWAFLAELVVDVRAELDLVA